MALMLVRPTSANDLAGRPVRFKRPGPIVISSHGRKTTDHASHGAPSAQCRECGGEWLRVFSLHEVNRYSVRSVLPTRRMRVDIYELLLTEEIREKDVLSDEDFGVGDHVQGNSKAAIVSGTVVGMITKDEDFNGYIHQGSI